MQNDSHQNVQQWELKKKKKRFNIWNHLWPEPEREVMKLILDVQNKQLFIRSDKKNAYFFLFDSIISNTI